MKHAKPGVDLLASVDFHKHLDACRQCMNQPFNLCPKGTALLRKAVTP